MLLFLIVLWLVFGLGFLAGGLWAGMARWRKGPTC